MIPAGLIRPAASLGDLHSQYPRNVMFVPYPYIVLHNSSQFKLHAVRCSVFSVRSLK